MAIDIDKTAQEAINAIADKIKNLKTLNIIVVGKTGVGKSTLINAVFDIVNISLHFFLKDV